MVSRKGSISADSEISHIDVDSSSESVGVFDHSGESHQLLAPLKVKQPSVLQVPDSSPSVSVVAEPQLQHKSVYDPEDGMKQSNIKPLKSQAIRHKPTFKKREGTPDAEVITIPDSPPTVNELERARESFFKTKSSSLRFDLGAYEPPSLYEPPRATTINPAPLPPPPKRPKTLIPMKNSISNQYAQSLVRPERTKQSFDSPTKPITSGSTSSCLETLAALYPKVDPRVLIQVLSKAKNNVEDAALILADMEASNEPEEMKSPNSDVLNRVGQDLQVKNDTDDNKMRRPLKQPQLSIREKHAIKSKAWNESQVAPPQIPAVAKRKKLRQKTDAEVQRRKSPEVYSDESSASGYSDEEDESMHPEVLQFFNKQSKHDIVELTGCPVQLAELIVQNRPWDSIQALNDFKLAKHKNGRTFSTVVMRMVKLLTSLRAVDKLIENCESIGMDLEKEIAYHTKVSINGNNNSMLNGHSTTIKTITQSPEFFSAEFQLKEYQLAGLNWLNIIYQKRLSCILADEMGLGKTCQIIALFAHLLSLSRLGPHLVVVPASTIENWVREFERFAPTLTVEIYHGSQQQRAEIAADLQNRSDYHVVLTTYSMATSSGLDRQFLRHLRFDIATFDEGHLLKNSASTRYRRLMAIPAKCRILLTGTPLQNDLRELMSLLCFMLPTVFANSEEAIETVFTLDNSQEVENRSSMLLSARRVDRARKIMTPFVLRRKKQEVLKELPGKQTELVYCDMPPFQASLYKDLKAKSLAKLKETEEQEKTKSQRVHMMEFRKAANHPLLFRQLYDDKKLQKIATKIMKEPRYIDANKKFIIEDMEVMNDFELHKLCLQYPKTVGDYALLQQDWMNAAKIQKLKQILPNLRDTGEQVLLFSQFTQVLDILELVMQTLEISFIRMDGSTSTDSRQDLIDQFHEETDITVFLLSTKAGGFGINLACASTVILYDVSFNPHDDRQAEDRAHRLGQKKDVHVLRLLATGSIDEYIMKLGDTKLELDASLSTAKGGKPANIEKKAENFIIQMMIEAGEYGTPVESNSSSKDVSEIEV